MNTEDHPLRSSKRLLSVDCLRGLAIASVLFAHGGLPADLFMWWMPKRVFEALGRNGYYGVAIFFVISGFLITSRTMQRHGSPRFVDPKDFYIMRIGRIVPGLLLSLSLIYLCFRLGVGGFQPPDPQQVTQGIYAAATLQYHVFFPVRGGGPGMDPLSIFWSLSIEEVFYIIFPVLCVVCLRKRVFACVLLGVALFGPVYRTEEMAVFRWWGSADLLAIGCLTGLAAPYVAHRVSSLASVAMQMAALCAIGAIYLFLPREAHYRFGPSLVGLAVALFLVVSLRHGNLPRLLASSACILWPLAVIGGLSYELYITHMTIRYIVTDIVLSNGLAKWVYDLAMVLIVVPAAILMAKVYTEPSNRAIRRFYARRLPHPPEMKAHPSSEQLLETDVVMSGD
jgi:peptidoglycan/LPS O-acetylase OafA/YrhL